MSGNPRRKYGAKIRLTLDEVTRVNNGAYAQVLQDAAIIALLVPSGGAGLVPLLQRLFLAG